MTDTEKIALITNMISDFWEGYDEETCNAAACGLVTAIYSVSAFKEEEQ